MELGELFKGVRGNELIILVSNNLFIHDMLSLASCNRYLRNLLRKKYTGPLTYQSLMTDPYRLVDFNNMIISYQMFQSFKKMVCMLYITEETDINDSYENDTRENVGVIRVRYPFTLHDILDIIIEGYNITFLTFDHQLTVITSSYREYIEEKEGMLIENLPKIKLLILASLIVKGNTITVINDTHHANAISYSLISNLIKRNYENGKSEIIWRYPSDYLLGMFLRKLNKDDSIDKDSIEKITIITDNIITNYCPLKEALITTFKCSYNIIGNHNCENVRKFDVSRYKDRGSIITCELDDITISFLQQSAFINVSFSYQCLSNRTNIFVTKRI